MGVKFNPFSSTLDVVDSPSGDFADVELDQGTAAAPSISFNGDPNTGIYSPGADQVAISTNGTGRLFIDASGNIGVGVASPERPIHLPDGNVLLLGTTAATGTQLQHTGSANFLINNKEAGAQIFYTNDTERLRITSDGKLGLGTSAPSQKLEVGNVGGNVTTGDLLVDTTSGAAEVIVGRLSSTGGDSTSFRVRNRANGQLFFVDGDSGNVGLGTSTLRQVAERTANIQTERTGAGGGAALSLLTNSSSGVPSQLTLGASRGAAGTPTSVLSTDVVGLVNFFGADGTDYDKVAASIRARAVGTITTDQVPGQLEFYTAENAAGSTLTQRLTIDNQGRVGIGTASPAVAFQVGATGSGGAAIDTTNSTIHGTFGSGGNLTLRAQTNAAAGGGEIYLGGSTRGDSNVNAIIFSAANSERARIDSSGRLLVGTSSARANFENSTITTRAQVEGTGTTTSSLGLISNSGTAGGNGPFLYFARSKGSAVGSNDLVSANDHLGGISFQGNDGSEFVQGATIRAEVDGTPGANDMPGRLVFSTTADSASSPTERMRITSAGNLLVNTTSVLINESQISATGAGNTACFKTTVASNNPVLLWNSATSGDNIFASFFTETSYTVRGTIDYNRAAGQVRYNTTSDQRLKSNIQDSDSSLNILGQIKVRSYDWAETGHSIPYGFVAQELHQAVPDAVKVGDSGNEVTNAWAVDNSKLVPLLTKALQEALAEIESLKARVTALEP